MSVDLGEDRSYNLAGSDSAVATSLCEIIFGGQVNNSMLDGTCTGGIVGLIPVFWKLVVVMKDGDYLVLGERNSFKHSLGHVAPAMFRVELCLQIFIIRI
jgi:hypothetical protein